MRKRERGVQYCLFVVYKDVLLITECVVTADNIVVTVSAGHWFITVIFHCSSTLIQLYFSLPHSPSKSNIDVCVCICVFPCVFFLP